jgi:hypothetical protein
LSDHAIGNLVAGRAMMAPCGHSPAWADWTSATAIPFDAAMIVHQYRDIRESRLGGSLMSTRFITVALLALAAAAPWPAAAQAVGNPNGAKIIAVLSELVGQDGGSKFYSGVISWTNKEGATETVSAYVTNGRVQCDGTYVSPNLSRIIQGPGLIEMSLGQGDNDKYSFKVACPNATTPGEPADFRYSYDSYEQPGGTVEFMSNQKVRLPLVLKGSRSEPYDNGGFISMTWKLCTRASDCPPPRKPTP